MVRSYGITGRRHCYQNSVRGGLALFESEHHFLNLVVILLCKVLLREVNTTSFCVRQGVSECTELHLQQESSSDGGSAVLGAEVWKWQRRKKGVCVFPCVSLYVCVCVCMPVHSQNNVVGAVCLNNHIWKSQIHPLEEREVCRELPDRQSLKPWGGNGRWGGYKCCRITSFLLHDCS